MTRTITATSIQASDLRGPGGSPSRGVPRLAAALQGPVSVPAQATFFMAESTVFPAWRSSMPIVICEKP